MHVGPAEWTGGAVFDPFPDACLMEEMAAHVKWIGLFSILIELIDADWTDFSFHLFIVLFGWDNLFYFELFLNAITPYHELRDQ